MTGFLFIKVENIVGKGEIADYQHFLLFRQYFQKFSVHGWLKFGNIVVIVNDIQLFYVLKFLREETFFENTKGKGINISK